MWLSSVYGPHMHALTTTPGHVPHRSADGVLERSPPRPCSGHHWAPGQSVELFSFGWNVTQCPRGSSLDSGSWNTRVSQWHKLPRHPELPTLSGHIWLGIVLHQAKPSAHYPQQDVPIYRHMFTAVSPDSFKSVTCAQCEPLICKENRVPLLDCQFLCSLANANWAARCRSERKPH